LVSAGFSCVLPSVLIIVRFSPTARLACRRALATVRDVFPQVGARLADVVSLLMGALWWPWC